jgi:hypothetical protein
MNVLIKACVNLFLHYVSPLLPCVRDPVPTCFSELPLSFCHNSMYNISVHTQHVWVPTTACTTSVYTHNMCGFPFRQHVQHQCTHTTCVGSPFNSMYDISVHTQHVWVLTTACTTCVHIFHLCCLTLGGTCFSTPQNSECFTPFNCSVTACKAITTAHGLRRSWLTRSRLSLSLDATQL